MSPVRLSLAALLGALLVAGCGSSSDVKVEPLGPAITSKLRPAAEGEALKAKNGAELWEQQCNRCHYARSPSFYNDAQWDVAMMHMRVRAKLTTDDYNAILDFLKSGRP
jgi:cytochrome c5